MCPDVQGPTKNVYSIYLKFKAGCHNILETLQRCLYTQVRLSGNIRIQCRSQARLLLQVFIPTDSALPFDILIFCEWNYIILYFVRKYYIALRMLIYELIYLYNII